ncbi:epoxide hydrolase N-terminal domain-containing protein [Streptomyces niveiscabiei]|uniref:epoxide hydrolase N-terminal domain-containing protein n=1 Tax=Streptomyces niveiscabiei TaxID=164115 RepID=UPI0029A8DAE3|nr:epoxide hydrolase N-terminal domain-containing protein [Streptomyces niveiscabiei]MDX3383234.1 epoxide hydrolase N-terminal domain-containing protein [Streptomyces niveiscabiei]
MRWTPSYDGRAHERRLTSFARYTTEIDGQNVHFPHVRPAKPDALPLIVTPGRPGSVVEFGKVVEPLAGRGGVGRADAAPGVRPSRPPSGGRPPGTWAGCT